MTRRSHEACEDITSQEETDLALARSVSIGDELAGSELFERYDGLMKYHANKAKRLITNPSVSFDDLVQAGWEHGIRQLKAYTETERDYSLTQAMARYVLEAMNRNVIDKQYAIQLSEQASRIIKRIQFVNSQRIATRRPIMSEEEISEEFDIPVGDLENSRLTTGVIMRAMRMTRLMGSIDGGFEAQADFSLGDRYNLGDARRMTPVDREPDKTPEDEVEQTDLRERVLPIIVKAEPALTARQKEALIYSFGFDRESGEPRTGDEVGELMGVTGKASSQLVLRALEKIRDNPELLSQLQELR